MEKEEIDRLLDDLLGSLRLALLENQDRGTTIRRDSVAIMGHVNKSLWRLLMRDRTRDEDCREIIDAMAYLAILYKIRREPYGEY